MERALILLDALAPGGRINKVKNRVGLGYLTLN